MKKGKLLSFLVLSLLLALTSITGAQANTITDKSNHVETIDMADVEGPSCPECGGQTVYGKYYVLIPVYWNGEIIDYYIHVMTGWYCPSCLVEA